MMGNRESGDFEWTEWFVILGWIKSQIEILPTWNKSVKNITAQLFTEVEEERSLFNKSMHFEKGY